MKLTRQGVRNLDELGPRRPARRPSAQAATCQTPDDHDWGAWEEDVAQTLAGPLWAKWRTCKRCGMQEDRR